MIVQSNPNSNQKQNYKDNLKDKENDIIVKPIVFGSIAFWLGKKADETVSHKWCIYVRGLNNEDISYFVKEVVFTLHASFENHVRVVNKFPFELYESGWGQFDIIISIHLIDENAKPIEFVHPLKLYPTQAHASMSTKKPVVSESYDEIIFVNPNPQIKEILLNPPITLRRDSSSIQIPMNIDDDRKSNDYSYFSQDDKSNLMVDKNPVVKNMIPPLNTTGVIPKEPSFKITNTFEDKFGNMNMNPRMDGSVITNQVGVTPSLQQKIEDMNIDSSYKAHANAFIGEFDSENVNNSDNFNNANIEMNVDIPNNQTDNISMVSNSLMEVDKEKGKEDKKINSFIPNIHQYYMPVDDSVHYKILEDANKFIIQEINRLKKSLEDNDREVVNIKKNIKEITTKL